MTKTRSRTARQGRSQLPKAPLKASMGIFAAALLAFFLAKGRPAPAPVPVPTQLPDWIQQALLPVNEWSRPGTAMEAVNGVVVHYVGNPGTTAGQNWNYFEGLSRTHETYASSNFLIGLDGEVLLCVPMGEVAYCSSQRNKDTLSIEVCHPDETGKFNPKTYASLVKLVNYLLEFYGLEPEDVLRHYDVTGKICPKYFVENPAAWEEFQKALSPPEPKP